MKRSDYRRRGDPEPEYEKEVSPSTATTDPNLRWITVKTPASNEVNPNQSIYELLIKSQLDSSAAQSQNDIENSNVQDEGDSDENVEAIDDDGEEIDEWSRPIILVPGPGQVRTDFEELGTEPIKKQLILTTQLPFDHFTYLPVKPKPPQVNASLDFDHEFLKKNHEETRSSINPPRVPITMVQYSPLNQISLTPPPVTKAHYNHEYGDEVPSSSKKNENDSSDASSFFKLKAAQKYTNKKRDLKNRQYLSSEESEENWDDDEFLTLSKKEKNLPTKSTLIIKPPEKCITATNVNNFTNENSVVHLDCSWLKAGRVLVSNIGLGQKGRIDVVFKDSAINIKIDTPQYFNRHANSYGADFTLNIPYDSVIAFKANYNVKNRRNSYFLELGQEKCEEIRTLFKLQDWLFGSASSKDYSIKLFKFSTTGMNTKTEDLNKLKNIFGNRFVEIDVKTAESYSNPLSYNNSENNSKLKIRGESPSRSRSPRRRSIAAYFFNRSSSRSSSRSKKSSSNPRMIPRRRSKSTERRVRQRRKDSSSSDSDHQRDRVFYDSDNKSEVTSSRSNIQILQGTEMNKLCSTSDKTKAMFNCYLIKVGIRTVSAIGNKEKGIIKLKLSHSTIEIDVDTPQFKNIDYCRPWRISIPTSSVVSLQVYSKAHTLFKNKNTFFLKLTSEEMNKIRSKFRLSYQEFPHIEDGDDDTRQYFAFCTTRHEKIIEDLLEIKKIFQGRLTYITYNKSEYYLGKRSNPGRGRSISRSVSSKSSRSRSKSLSRDRDCSSTTVNFSCQLLSFGKFTAASNVNLGVAESEENKIEIRFDLNTIDIQFNTDSDMTDQQPQSMKIPIRSVRKILVYYGTTNSYCFLKLSPIACEKICQDFKLNSNDFNSNDEIKDIKSKYMRFLTSKFIKGNDTDIMHLRRIFGRRLEKIDYKTVDDILHGENEPSKKGGEKRKSQSSSSSSSRSRSRSASKRNRSNESQSSKRSSLPVIAPSTSPSSQSQVDDNSYLFTYQLASVHFGGICFKDNIQGIILPSTKAVRVLLKSTENEQVELRIPHHNVKKYYLAEFKSDESSQHFDCLVLYFRMTSDKFVKIFSNKIGTDLSSQFNPESRDYKLCYTMLIIKTEDRFDLEKKSVVIQAALGDGCEFIPKNEKVLETVNEVIRDNLNLN